MINPKNRRKIQRNLIETGRWILITLFVIFAIAPVLWLVQMSFKTEADAFSMPPKFTVPTLENYEGLVQEGFMNALSNSFKVSTLTTVLSLVLGVPASYALARLRLRRGKTIRLWILSTRMAPPIAFALPFFLLYRQIGLIDTLFGLAIIFLVYNLSLVIWLMENFFINISKSLEEAAYIDGASPWQAFWHVTLPLATPGVATAAIFSYLIAWNDFFFALVLTRAEAKTAPVAITDYVSFLGWEWGKIAAGSVLVMLPSLFFAVLVRKYLVSGLTSGALKE